MIKVFIYGGLFLALTLFAVGCDGQTIPDANSPPAIIYADRCGKCHTPFHPQTHTFTGWKNVIPKMEKKVEATGIRPLLSEEEMNIILAYLKKHARRGF